MASIKCKKTLWRLGLRPGPRWRNLQRSPRPLAGGEGTRCPLHSDSTPALGLSGLGLRASLIHPPIFNPKTKILATCLVYTNYVCFKSKVTEAATFYYQPQRIAYACTAALIVLIGCFRSNHNCQFTASTSQKCTVIDLTPYSYHLNAAASSHATIFNDIWSTLYRYTGDHIW